MVSSVKSSGSTRLATVLKKSGIQIATVLLPAAILSNFSSIAGALWALIGSFVFLASNYNKEWKLSTLSILLPPAALLITFLIQMQIFWIWPPETFLIGVVVGGVLLGIFRGNTHKVFLKENSIFAQKSTAFLFIWFISFGITQTLAMMGQTDFGVGRSGSLFSISLMIAFSIVLFGKFVRQSGRKRLRPTSANRILLIFLLLMLTPILTLTFISLAQNGAEEFVPILNRVIQPSDLPNEFNDTEWFRVEGFENSYVLEDNTNFAARDFAVSQRRPLSDSESWYANYRFRVYLGLALNDFRQSLLNSQDLSQTLAQQAPFSTAGWFNVERVPTSGDLAFIGEYGSNESNRDDGKIHALVLVGRWVLIVQSATTTENHDRCLELRNQSSGFSRPQCWIYDEETLIPVARAILINAAQRLQSIQPPNAPSQPTPEPTPPSNTTPPPTTPPSNTLPPSVSTADLDEPVASEGGILVTWLTSAVMLGTSLITRVVEAVSSDEEDGRNDGTVVPPDPPPPGGNGSKTIIRDELIAEFDRRRDLVRKWNPGARTPQEKELIEIMDRAASQGGIANSDLNKIRTITKDLWDQQRSKIGADELNRIAAARDTHVSAIEFTRDMGFGILTAAAAGWATIATGNPAAGALVSGLSEGAQSLIRGEGSDAAWDHAAKGATVEFITGGLGKVKVIKNSASGEVIVDFTGGFVSEFWRTGDFKESLWGAWANAAGGVAGRQVGGKLTGGGKADAGSVASSSNRVPGNFEPPYSVDDLKRMSPNLDGTVTASDWSKRPPVFDEEMVSSSRTSAPNQLPTDPTRRIPIDSSGRQSVGGKVSEADIPDRPTPPIIEETTGPRDGRPETPGPGDAAIGIESDFDFGEFDETKPVEFHDPYPPEDWFTGEGVDPNSSTRVVDPLDPKFNTPIGSSPKRELH